MGQAASMCRFRGCRYKKNKSSKTTTTTTNQTTLTATPTLSPTATPKTTPTTPTATVATIPTTTTTTTAINMSPQQMPSGLQLRSIEEPAAPLQISSRMAAEQGGTGYCVAENGSLIGQRGIGVPLPLSQHSATHPLTTSNAATATTQQQLQLQSQQQQQQQQLQYHHHHHHQQQQHFHSYKAYDAEYARMESWLDENQEFVQDYFIRKATRQTVDAWLVSHATLAGNDLCSNSPTHANGPSGSSRGGSGATTPVRKISAHEFERGGLLKPIVNTIDGTPTFLSIGPQMEQAGGMGGSGNTGSSGQSGSSSQYQYHQYHPTYQSHQAGSGCVAAVGSGSNGGMSAQHQHHHQYQYHHNYHHRPQRLSRNELKQLDEKELIFELVKDICNELEVRTLCHKILQNVSILLNADRGSLFLVQGRCNGADGLKKCLVSKLFDVCPRSTVEEMEQQEEVRVAWGTGIAGHVAESGEPVNIPDAYQDERFNCEIDTLTGYRTKALLCMPIKDSSGDVIGVAQVINKLNGECFSETDEKVFASYLQFCGIGLRNAQLFEKSQLEIKRNQVLLDLARMIFEEQSTIEHMVLRILTHMQSLIQCQRVQILLVHEASKGSFSRVFDFEANDLSEEEATSRTSPYESRFPINIGITGHAATTGETINIPNAYEDDRFDPSVDDASGFKHRSILCMAIKNSLGQIIGVIQLINKFNELDFTKNDENFVEAFAIFCGMGIHNTHMYEKAIVAMAKQSVTLEVLSYHASATMDEAHRLRRLRVPSAAHFRLHDFKFDDIHFEDDDTLKACLRMFLDLDFVERFHIDYEVLCRWLLSVKKNYRNVTYHNWRHAFNVAQMMFAILTTTQWWKIFGEIECLALIIGCLCHDLDHRGTNNSFQIKASSPLAQLYSTSTMEHHHFDQCLMILNSPGNQILANLSSDDYCRVIRVLEDAILSTDLAVYFRKRGPFLDSVSQPMSYWVDEEPRALLRAMSMTVCDLSAITKPWDIEKRVADLVSSEFFEQGDMEKQELNITPIDIMNREKEDELPMMQVNFIDSICLPIYEAFATLSDKLEPLVEGVRDNRSHWIDMAENEQPVANNTTETQTNSGQSTDKLVISTGNTNTNLNNNNKANNMLNGKVDSSTDTEQCAEESANDDEEGHDTTNEDHGIEADDDDSEVEAYHSYGCYSTSSNSSRLSTPPPTGEDDSTPTSPTKTPQAKLIADNLNALNRKTTVHKSRNISCKTCEYARTQNVRKTSSLKGANEIEESFGKQLANGKCNAHAHKSKSTPTMTNCGQHHCQHYLHHHQQQHHHHHHCGHHHHHHSHNHHNHNHHQQQHTTGIGSASMVGSSVIGIVNVANNAANAAAASPESDKIPKIVGKLGNLDGLPYTAAANGGIGFQPNGHFSNFVPHGSGHVLTRRHSETTPNGSIQQTQPVAAVAEK